MGQKSYVYDMYIHETFAPYIFSCAYFCHPRHRLVNLSEVEAAKTHSAFFLTCRL